jgi:hypothetical protein
MVKMKETVKLFVIALLVGGFYYTSMEMVMADRPEVVTTTTESVQDGNVEVLNFISQLRKSQCDEPISEAELQYIKDYDAVYLFLSQLPPAVLPIVINAASDTFDCNTYTWITGLVAEVNQQP